MKKTSLLSVLVTLVVLLTQCSQPADVAQWRGDNRDGKFSDTGLLKSWPKDGPNLLWFADSLPDGYSALSIVDNTIYTTGIDDKQDVLFALDMSGKLKWRVDYGRAWERSFVLSRATPTVEENRIYVSSGKGDVACVDAVKGSIIWSKKASEDYNAPYGHFGISESILIVDNMAIYTPGGDETTVVAYDKLTGDVIWKSESLKDNPSYTSPILVERGGMKLILQVSEKFIFGVDSKTGSIEWKYDFGKYIGGKMKLNVQTNTPLYHKGEIFVTSGYDHTAVMLSLSEDGKSVTEKWTTDVLDVHQGGVVLHNNHIYGSNWINNGNGNWVCLDWDTGEMKYEKKWKNKGTVVFADDKLYCYEEKRGNIALVNPTPEKFDIVSSFKVPHGKGPHWTYPVIHNKILYIRHGKAIMAYDIKKG